MLKIYPCVLYFAPPHIAKIIGKFLFTWKTHDKPGKFTTETTERKTRKCEDGIDPPPVGRTLMVRKLRNIALY